MHCGARALSLNSLLYGVTCTSERASERKQERRALALSRSLSLYCRLPHRCSNVTFCLARPTTVDVLQHTGVNSFPLGVVLYFLTQMHATQQTNAATPKKKDRPYRGFACVRLCVACTRFTQQSVLLLILTSPFHYAEHRHTTHAMRNKTNHTNVRVRQSTNK